MKRTGCRKPAIAALVLMTTMVSGTAMAQAAATGSSTTASQKIDPMAIQALRGMGAYLKTLQNFQIDSKATIETNVEDSDIKITVGMNNVYQVERPNKFHVSLRSDRQMRDYYYDGKKFTVSIPRQHFFAVADAPPTIAEVVDDMYNQYGITLPLSDLFVWAYDGAPTDGLLSALRIGYAKIGNIDTDQFAYRGEQLDFQIWIARGPRPLPVKMVITSRDPETRPSYSADLTWNTAAKFTPATFAFKPDAKTSQIQMAKASASGSN
ncbi:MAG TPA: DUF2092 domain-containing protein [Sphingobium sp.]|uniref:DUF2092 domain-containing protein n=1 Tax=Sphingobium sp. TaxID=1912891 RepID=UPI002ED30964